MNRKARQTTLYLFGLAAALALFYAVAYVASGQEKKSPIRFPKTAATTPAVTVPLTPDTLYVIDADEPFAMIDGTQGVVRIIEKAGPLTMFAKFYGGSGAFEFRTFAGKQVWIVQAIGTGKVDLIGVPKTWASAADFKRETISVDIGGKPVPDPPKPDPTPKPASQIKHLTFVGLDATSATVINDQELRAYLKDTGVAVHVYAVNDPALTKLGLQTGVVAAGGVPCWIAQDGAGNILTQAKTTTSAALKDGIKTYVGAK